jgi:hypothetical protein
MQIDLAQVDWLYVALLAVSVFVANLVANFVSFSHKWISGVVAAFLFSVIFVFWTYYPHGLPLPTSAMTQTSPMKTEPPTATASAMPARPSNPVRDVTPQ